MISISNMQNLFRLSAKIKQDTRQSERKSRRDKCFCNISFAIVYCTLLCAMYGIRLGISWTEDFPHNVTKPVEVKYFDTTLDIMEFLIAMAYQLSGYWCQLTVMTGCTALILKCSGRG